ncbi:MAG: class I SAM-dependent methyltransferase [Alphaproteobacteria bacterium]|nr:class I SAM-dependent methyltransferase [Alphaproteobacteria bacterium]
MKRKTAEQIQGAVQSQYERFPYPPPLDAISSEILEGNGFMMGCPSREFHIYWPSLPERRDLDILIAGCGSSQAVQDAYTLPEARFTAIDLSQTSIDNSKRLMAQHGVKNIEFHQMSLYDVEELGRDFDLIVSTGVIHHLPDPAAGLRALRKVLRRDGSMLLLLYGRYGRDSVYLFQQMFRLMGISGETVTEEQIAQMVDLVRNVPPTHPFHLRKDIYNDFRPAEIVDLYLHPQDVAYTVPEIYDLLAEAGLSMQRFIQQAPYVPRFSGLLGHPFYEKVDRMSDREQFAITELYRAGMYTHTFVACRDDRPEASYRIDFEGASFWKYVPRIRGTVNQSPRSDGRPGVAITVSGHGKFQTEILLDPAQVFLIGRMDGQKTVQDIVDELSEHHDGETARSFVMGALRDLWMFDVIAFQIPAVRSRPARKETTV